MYPKFRRKLQKIDLLRAINKDSKQVDVRKDDCEKNRKTKNKEPPLTANAGNVGQLIDGCQTTFFAIAFPHGNSITDDDKVVKYKELKDFLDTEMKDS
jgi:hypothetical protein